MDSRKQIIVLVVLLMLVGISAVTYKHKVLGFPLFSGETETVWSLEARVDFVADGGPVTVNLNLPDPRPERKITLHQSVAPGYTYERVQEGGTMYGRWQTQEATGEQTLYLRADVYYVETPDMRAQQKPEINKPKFSEARALAAQRLVDEIKVLELPHQKQIVHLLTQINERSNSALSVLIQPKDTSAQTAKLTVDLLAMLDVPARLSRGIFLADNKRKQSALFFLEVFDGEQWQLYDPRGESQVPWQKVIILQHSDEPLLEVFGGSQSQFSFSSLREKRPAFKAAVDAARMESSALVDFSIYSLPLAEQNQFKLLLLIPLGALVVVILRNLVGIRTSGTFMPILIALTFLQTSLLTGLGLFLIVVGVGLVMRSYLSRLNLLLVPRIASVLVFVIIIYAAIGIASHKLGLAWGMKVTFFPMIILSWTIERMSILWDEEGVREVLIQGGGSLLTATLAYLLMSNKQVADTVFLYPELLLVLLAIIVSIGSYSGYRLSDLRRFEPMEKL